MHPSSYRYAEEFITKYLDPNKPLQILDVGSFNANGTLRPLLTKDSCTCTQCSWVEVATEGNEPDCPKCNVKLTYGLGHNGTEERTKIKCERGAEWVYTGIDIKEACSQYDPLNPNNKDKNIDILMDDPYVYPIEDDSYDVIVSTSVFEHIPFFWVTFDELVRITKPGGLVYLNTPLAPGYHGYPYDCWRFEEDSYKALSMWNKKAELIESFVDRDVTYSSNWMDSIGIFKIKDKGEQNDYVK